MMELSIRELSPDERKYTYTQSTQISGQTGCLGHLRADFGSNGMGFYSSWDDCVERLKTQEFKDEFDSVINKLRDDPEYDGILKSRDDMRNYCYAGYDKLTYGNDREFGIRVDTDKYAYLMRLNPNKGEYNLYCYCYVKDWLDRHLERASQGIRFIDPDYNEKFRIPDGNMIRIKLRNGEHRDRTVRFIDEYHVEIGDIFDGNIYHICEFAERVAQSEAEVIPLRSSLPEKCYVYVESTDEIGVVTRGENGYAPTGAKPEGGVSKRKAVEYLNDAMGVTPAEAAAMSAGSMFGWDTKAADPKSYDSEGNPLMNKRKDRGDER